MNTVEKRLKDIELIGNKWGSISKLANLWNISHTQVRRFIKQHVFGIKRSKRQTLKYIQHICIDCNDTFFTTRKNSTRCKSCRAIYVNSFPKAKGDLRKKGSGGLREGGGHAKVFTYNSMIAGKMKLNQDEIALAKIFDSQNLNWCRNTKGFEYTNEQFEKHKFFPDFYMKDFDVYVEYKGWVTDKINLKMLKSQEQNKFKLLIIYGDYRRTRDLGLNIGQILHDNSLLEKTLKSYGCMAKLV